MNIINRIVLSFARSAVKRAATVDNLNAAASTIACQILSRSVKNPAKFKGFCDLVAMLAPIAQRAAEAIGDGQLTPDEAAQISIDIATAFKGSTISDADLSGAVDALFDRISEAL